MGDIQFAQSLRQFVNDDRVVREKRARDAVGFVGRNSGKWAHGPMVLFDVSAKILGATPLPAELAAGIAREQARRGVLRLRQSATASTPRRTGEAILAEICARIAVTVFEKTVQVMGDYAAPRVAEFNEELVKEELRPGSQSVEHYSTQAKTLMETCQALADNEEFGVGEIVVAAHLLQIVLHHTSTSVDHVVQKLPDTKFAKLAGWTFGSAVAVGGTAALGMCPVTMFPGLALYAAYGAFCGGAATSVCTVAGSAVAGVEWTKTKTKCRELEINLRNIDDNIKAFCSFLGFLYHKITELDQLNDDEYLAEVRRLNQSLPRDVEVWSNPAYVSTYIEIESNRLNNNLSEIVSGMASLGL